MKTSTLSLRERLAFWDAHPLVGIIPISLPFSHAPFRMTVNNDDTVVKTLYWDGFSSGWETESLRLWANRAASARCVLDIGSYTGIYALLAGASGAGTTIAFEPSAANHKRLCENISLNDMAARIRAERLAVSNASGEAVFHEKYAGPGILATVHSLRPNGGVPTRVSTVTIDEYLRDAEAGPVDLIKIDIEHAEGEALEGMRNTLATDKPDIIIEAASESAWKEIRRRIPRGYRAYAIDEMRGVTTPRLGGLSRRRLRHRGNRNHFFTTRG